MHILLSSFTSDLDILSETESTKTVESQSLQSLHNTRAPPSDPRPNLSSFPPRTICPLAFTHHVTQTSLPLQVTEVWRPTSPSPR